MKKSLYLFSLVVFLGLGSMIEAVSGFILWFVLPSGTGRRGLEAVALGITRHTWIDIHDWVAVALTVAVIIHLVLHWRWVVRMSRQIVIQLTGAYHQIKHPAEVH
jgi:hypothetical protein